MSDSLKHISYYYEYDFIYIFAANKIDHKSNSVTGKYVSRNFDFYDSMRRTNMYIRPETYLMERNECYRTEISIHCISMIILVNLLIE